VGLRLGLGVGLDLFCGLPSVFSTEHFGCYLKEFILITIHARKVFYWLLSVLNKWRMCSKVSHIHLCKLHQDLIRMAWSSLFLFAHFSPSCQGNDVNKFAGINLTLKYYC